MFKYDGELSFTSDVTIRYGKQKNLKYNWKEIISKPNEKEMKKCIDELIESLSKNKEENGFFAKDDFVECGMGHGFLLDDKEIYYIFFKNLKELYESTPNPSSQKDPSFVFHAIIKTVIDYAGGDGVNRRKRFELTSLEVSDEDMKYPSISKQKGQNCFYCTERAAIAHNLWLLTGATSYFCKSFTTEFEGADLETKNDAHHFTIVEVNNKFVLFDLAMNNFCNLPSDCIDNMLNGKGLKVDNVKNSGVYVKAALTKNELN